MDHLKSSLSLGNAKVLADLPKSRNKSVHKLLTYGIIRFVTRFRYCDDITILLQLCIVYFLAI